MPSKIFGVDIRRASPPNDKSRAAKSSPTASITEIRRPSVPSMDHIKRPSLPGLVKKAGSHERKGSKDRSLSKDKNVKDQRSPMQQQMVKLGMFMESPPVLFLAAPQHSTGALLSGRLQVTPNIPEATVETIAMYLECTTTTKRPVADRCRECMSKVSDLFEWKFLTKPKLFYAQDGMQELPFSHLIPGHLPATTHGQIGSIDYSLHVRAKTSDGQDVEFRRPVIFQRALFPGPDKSSVRIFPPTNLQLHVTLPSIVHPIGEFPVQCRMTGITTKRENETQVRWRLRKLHWRIEETETMVSPACAKHAAKVGGEGKGIKHENTREIGDDELKQGWKTDFSAGDIEGEFMASIDSALKAQCAMEAENGLKISHNLVLELVIAEEWATNTKPDRGTPTGAARVLRTQFTLNVTERAGLGVAWDDEQPPQYDEVPQSPPHYVGDRTTTTISDYQGEDLHQDVEQLNLGT